MASGREEVGQVTNAQSSIVNEKADGILERAGSFLLSHSETTVWVFPKPPCSLGLPWQVRTGNKEITALIISLLQMSVLVCKL